MRSSLIKFFTTTQRGSKCVSRFSNGLRVMTWNERSALSAVGVLALMGPRSETDGLNEGCSAIFERFLLNVENSSISGQMCVADAFAHMGNAISISNHRECLSYTLLCPSYYVNHALEVLSSAFLNANYTEATLHEAKSACLASIPARSRDPAKWCFELLHNAAYSHRTLGKSSFYTEEQISKITPDLMNQFIGLHVNPSSVVITASGIDNHEEFVRKVGDCFTFKSAKADGIKNETVRATYTGGLLMHHDMKPPASVEKFAEKNNTHIALFLPMQSGMCHDYYVACVTQCLLGGGHSFSSGGPGKGMLTKLYREVIQREGWIHSVECITAAYTDSAMFGLYGNCPHDLNEHLLDVLMFQIATIPKRIDHYHVNMAKQHLLSQFFLVNDTSAVVLEDAGRQLLLFDDILTFDEVKSKIMAVTLEEIEVFCEKLLKNVPSVAVYGNTSRIKTVEEIHSTIQKYSTNS